MKIKIRVHSNSSQEKIEKISEREYGVWLRENQKITEPIWNC